MNSEMFLGVIGFRVTDLHGRVHRGAYRDFIKKDLNPTIHTLTGSMIG